MVLISPWKLSLILLLCFDSDYIFIEINKIMYRVPVHIIICAAYVLFTHINLCIYVLCGIYLYNTYFMRRRVLNTPNKRIELALFCLNFSSSLRNIIYNYLLNVCIPYHTIYIRVQHIYCCTLECIVYRIRKLNYCHDIAQILLF